MSKRRAIQTALEGRYGRHSEKLIEALERIAFGKAVRVETEMPGVVKVLSPTVSEMHGAIMDLLAYQHGRPRQGIDVEVEDKRARWNPDKLTLEELEQLERLTRKGQAALAPENTVDGQFKVDEPAAVPVCSVCKGKGLGAYAPNCPECGAC